MAARLQLGGASQPRIQRRSTPVPLPRTLSVRGRVLENIYEETPAELGREESEEDLEGASVNHAEPETREMGTGMAENEQIDLEAAFSDLSVADLCRCCKCRRCTGLRIVRWRAEQGGNRGAATTANLDMELE